MMKLKDMITEALSMDVAKEYSKIYDKKLYNEIFKGKHRIYIPLSVQDDSLSSNFHDTIKKELENNGYQLIDYKKNVARKKDNNQSIKITKALSYIKRNDLMQVYNADPYRLNAKYKNLYIVISRHPYDIAGMSTDRRWTSCMNLGDNCHNPGVNAYAVKNEIVAESLIAYLVSEQDKNINYPLARVLLKVFKNDRGQQKLKPSKVYGNSIPQFLKEINNWLYSIQGSNDGFDTLNKFSYNDEDDLNADDWHAGDEDINRIGETLKFNRIWIKNSSSGLPEKYRLEVEKEITITYEMNSELVISEDTDDLSLVYDPCFRTLYIEDGEYNIFIIEENSDEFMEYVKTDIRFEDGDVFYKYNNNLYMMVSYRDVYFWNKEYNVWIDIYDKLKDDKLIKYTAGMHKLSSDFIEIDEGEAKKMM